jgi:hypothetical protein
VFDVGQALPDGTFDSVFSHAFFDFRQAKPDLCRIAERPGQPIDSPLLTTR